MQIRSNAESLAFLKGAKLEEIKSNQKLDVLLKTKHQLYKKQLGLNLAVNIFDYLGSIISYLALAVPIFTGRYDDVSSSELSSLISQVYPSYSYMDVILFILHNDSNLSRIRLCVSTWFQRLAPSSTCLQVSRNDSKHTTSCYGTFFLEF